MRKARVTGQDSAYLIGFLWGKDYEVPEVTKRKYIQHYGDFIDSSCLIRKAMDYQE